MAFRLACNLRLSREGRPADGFLASVLVGPSTVLDDVFAESANNARRFAFQESLVWSSNIGGHCGFVFGRHKDAITRQQSDGVLAYGGRKILPRKETRQTNFLQH